MAESSSGCVLVLDDAESIRGRVVDVLAHAGPSLQIVQAGTLADALEATRTIDVRAAIVDLGLPDGRGVDFIRSLRQSQPAAVIIVLTNHAEPQYRRACFENGAHFFLDKSTEFEHLTRVIGTIVNRRKPGAPRLLGSGLPPSPLQRDVAALASLHRRESSERRHAQALADVTSLAAHICAAPLAVITVTGRERRWFQANTSLDAGECEALRPLCEEVAGQDVMIVEDLAQAPGWSSQTLSVRGQRIRFCAGTRLSGTAGDYLGTLCVVDFVPRRLDDAQRAAFAALSRQVIGHLELRWHTSELHYREQQLRAIIDTQPECVKLISPDGTLMDMNPAGLRIIEADSFGQVERRSLLPLVSERDRPAFAQLTERVFLGESGTLQFQIAGLKGSKRWLETYATPLREESGRVAALLGVTRDITERKHAEERLREVLENIEEVFWETDAEKSKILYISPAFEKVWGRSPAELFESPRVWLDYVDAEDRDRITAAVNTQQSGHYNETYRIRRPDGTIRWIHERAFPIRDEGGTVTRIVGTASDITEQRVLEEQFRQAQKMESVGRLAGGIAHDFNNLLTVITGVADLALADCADPAQREAFLEIQMAGNRAAALTRQLLAFSRRQILQPQVVDVRAVIANLEKMLRRVIGEDVALNVVCRPDVGRVRVDPGQLDQVLLNLAVNARDAMPGGGTLTIEVSNVLVAPATAVMRQAAPGPHVLLAISDTGVGMDERIRRQIFEPFFTTKTHGKGTGLGLSTVYGIVRQSGGTVSVYSEPGLGTTFKIYLPLVNEPVAAAARELPPATATGNETILLVEDDAAVRDLTKMVLTRAGYTVLTAGNGTEALRLVEQHGRSIDLLMTDVVMPDISGPDLASRLTSAFPQLRILFTSGYTEEAMLRHNVLDDVTRFISKPFTPSDLKRRLREVLDRAES